MRSYHDRNVSRTHANLHASYVSLKERSIHRAERFSKLRATNKNLCICSRCDWLLALSILERFNGWSPIKFRFTICGTRIAFEFALCRLYKKSRVYANISTDYLPIIPIKHWADWADYRVREKRHATVPTVFGNGRCDRCKIKAMRFLEFLSI